MMPAPTPKPGLVLLSALLLPLMAVSAGELSRPVPPDAQVTRFTRFNLRYSLRDVAAASISKIEFYITEDMGRSWRFYGEDPDLTPPMTIEVPGEGVYGFASVATDRFGNRERVPVPRTRPETVIVVDRTPPQAKWLAPAANILGRGRTVELVWEASDLYFGPTPVKLQYSSDARSNHDRDAVWNVLREGLPASGQFSWTPAAGVSGRYNFRLIAEDRAGNLAVAYCPATITVDNAPPAITSLEPLRSNKLETPVIVTADDGPSGSGVKEISLYVSDNGGFAWNLLKERNANGESVPVKRDSGQAMNFSAPRAGDYALWPVAFDEAGNATPLPSVGVPGPYVLAIDDEPPAVNLQNSFLMGRAVVLSSESRTVSWTAYDPHILNQSAVIMLSLDGGASWQELRSGLPTSGSEIIYFPFGAQSEEAKLKVTAADEFGNIGESVSSSFRLAGAETVINSVTPSPGSAVPGSYPSAGNYEDPFGGESGRPPNISPPPSSGLSGPGYPPPPEPPPAAPPVASPPPLSGTGYQPLPPMGDFDLGAVPNASPPPPPPDPYQYPPLGGGDYISGESSAASLPRAMMGGLGDASPPPSDSVPPGPPPSSSRPPDMAWTPTPGAGGRSPAPSEPSVPSGGDYGGASVRPQSGAQTTPGSDPFGDDWFSRGMSGAGDMEPPPLSPSGGSEPPPFGSGLPGMDSLFGDIGFPPPEGAPDQTGPVGPPPAQSSQLQPPSLQPPPAPPGGILEPLPPPIEPPAPPAAPSAPPRPGNTRQISDLHIAEARRQLEEGNLDLSLSEATQALNADNSNYRAYMALSQVYAQQDPNVNNFARAATLAKEATNIGRNEWDAWWNCADIFYRWAHRRNLDAQGMIRGGQRPPVDVLDERNQALNNAQIAIGNSATLAQGAGEAERKKVAVTQGLVAYLRALTLPEPANPGDGSGQAAQDQYRRDLAAYKASASPVLAEALPYFQAAMRLGTPAYGETFHIGIINFRLAGLEKDGGNMAQAAAYYQEAARYLEEAATSGDTPPGGPREAYYMLAYCYDLMGDQPGPNRTRNKELALRYWRQTAEFYAPGTPYREYAIQRIEALSAEMGR